MILTDETISRFGYDPSQIKKFSKNIICVKCDVCNKEFTKSSMKVWMARKNSKSDCDVCDSDTCIKTKRENTMIRIYGVKNAGESSDIRKKVQSTCLRKYGTLEAMSSKIIQKKSKDGCLEKFGVENVFESDWCKEKIKNSTLLKFGCEWNSQSPQIRNKIKETFISKYGVDVATKNPTVKRKILNSWLNKIYESIETEKIRPMFSRKDFVGFKNNQQYKFQCKKCNNIFENNYIGVRCYKCEPLSRSKLEDELKEFISEIYSGEIKTNVRKIFDNKFEVDLYIPDKKIGIEIGSNYWHSEILGNKNKQYHLLKLTSCLNLGINLIQIFEDEWILKKDIVKARIRHILNLDSSKIYARDCIVKDIDFIIARDFLEKHHIQGMGSGNQICLGAFYKDELISVMTFGKLRRIMGYKSAEPDVVEMIRFCTKGSVIGIAGKLIKHMINTRSVRKIISYADRRWSNGNLYKKLGFKLVSEGTPNYWYLQKSKFLLRIHRFVFRKSELHKKLPLFDESLSEWENMKNNGYDRIWDCGSLKFELIVDDSVQNESGSQRSGFTKIT